MHLGVLIPCLWCFRNPPDVNSLNWRIKLYMDGAFGRSS